MSELSLKSRKTGQPVGVLIEEMTLVGLDPLPFDVSPILQELINLFDQVAVLEIPAIRRSFAFLTFEDGNGRVARAIADMALARSEESSQRFYSMSSQIRAERGRYYRILERTQKRTTDITDWMCWFLGCLGRAIERAETILESVFTKATFWKNVANARLNNRQRGMLNRLLDGFEGKLTSSKWAKLAKCSQDTALWDITDLINQGILIRNLAGGRSTSYRLQSGLLHDQH